MGNILHQFPIPLPSLGINISATPEELSDACKDALETEATWGIGDPSAEQMSEFSVVSVGNLIIASGRTTPVALQYRNSESVTVEMCYGGLSRFREGLTELRTCSGGILAFPNSGGVLCGNYHSGISFALEQERLKATAEAVLGCGTMLQFDVPRIVNELHHGKRTGKRESLMFSFFRHIDRVLSEDHSLPPALSLDDQIYRTFVVECARDAKLELLQRRGAGERAWSAILDDLVDYIRSNSHQHLSMTDLELRSSYSARHLQSLFRKRFNCTPMQFVRRQRLNAAMEKLQTADWDATVIQVARECGYRHTSNFTTDFQREFGVNPSVVLRSSRGGGE